MTRPNHDDDETDNLLRSDPDRSSEPRTRTLILIALAALVVLLLADAWR